ncbi:MAG: hypothetical protein QOJ71_2484, partial [Actinomycetota bacterium]|nr:hypothetical protein [Actinomycetota bacterium]
ARVVSGRQAHSVRQRAIYLVRQWPGIERGAQHDESPRPKVGARRFVERNMVDHDCMMAREGESA